MNSNRKNIATNVLEGVLLLLLCWLLNYIYFKYSRQDDLFFIFRLLQWFFVKNAIKHFSKCFYNWKHYNTLHKVVEFPDAIYPLVIKPYIKMYLSLILYVMVFYGGIYYVLKFVPEIFVYDLKYSTKAYLFITTCAVLTRTLGDWSIKVLVKWNYKDDNMKEHIDLTLSLFNENRIRFLLYAVYFISLPILSVLSSEEIQVFSYDHLSSAILSSFATFIAYERLFSNYSLIKFNPKEHLRQLIKVYEKDTKYKGKYNFLVEKYNSKSSSEK